jgi:hypothetical protein
MKLLQKKFKTLLCGVAFLMPGQLLVYGQNYDELLNCVYQASKFAAAYDSVLTIRKPDSYLKNDANNFLVLKGATREGKNGIYFFRNKVAYWLELPGEPQTRKFRIDIPGFEKVFIKTEPKDTFSEKKYIKSPTKFYLNTYSEYSGYEKPNIENFPLLQPTEKLDEMAIKALTEEFGLSLEKLKEAVLDKKNYGVSAVNSTRETFKNKLNELNKVQEQIISLEQSEKKLEYEASESLPLRREEKIQELATVRKKLKELKGQFGELEKYFGTTVFTNTLEQKPFDRKKQHKDLVDRLNDRLRNELDYEKGFYRKCEAIENLPFKDTIAEILDHLNKFEINPLTLDESIPPNDKTKPASHSKY